MIILLPINILTFFFILSDFPTALKELQALDVKVAATPISRIYLMEGHQA